MRAPIFLDRDGVINENRADYVKSWAEVDILPGALRALRRLSETAFRVVVVTNQSAVGRGIIALSQANEINRRLLEVIRDAGGRIDGVYLCPHHPDQRCACRKPQPGLLRQAASDLGLDLARSYLVGDSRTDLQAAVAVGAQGILVLTGRGKETAQSFGPKQRTRWPTVADLEAAVALILGGEVNSPEAHP